MDTFYETEYTILKRSVALKFLPYNKRFQTEKIT